jgi:ABC-type glycerol-3-phosphate transport system permease component
MSEIQTVELGSRADEATRTMREEEPKTGRFLFSPWHLVLIPIGVVMVIPLVWMLVTSLQTLEETRHYPRRSCQDRWSSTTTPMYSSWRRSVDGS